MSRPGRPVSILSIAILLGLETVIGSLMVFFADAFKGDHEAMGNAALALAALAGTPFVPGTA